MLGSTAKHMSLLPHIEVETNPSPDASVIWLHGLGADYTASDYESAHV